EPLQFATRRSRQAMGAHDEHGRGTNPVRFGQMAAGPVGNFMGAQRAVTRGLDRDAELLAIVRRMGEGRARAMGEVGTRPLHFLFEIGGVVIYPTNYNRLFPTTGNEQLALVEQPEVAGAQIAMGRTGE